MNDIFDTALGRLLAAVVIVAACAAFSYLPAWLFAPAPYWESGEILSECGVMTLQYRPAPKNHDGTLI